MICQEKSQNIDYLNKNEDNTKRIKKNLQLQRDIKNSCKIKKKIKRLRNFELYFYIVYYFYLTTNKKLSKFS